MISKEELKRRIDNEKEEKMQKAYDAPDILINGARVYTKDVDLNEDAVLSRLDGEMPKLMKYIIEQENMIAILHSYLKVGRTIVKLNNEIGQDEENNQTWLQEVEFYDPNIKAYKGIKKIFVNRIQSMLIFSRAKGGAVVKAFLNYNQQSPNEKELDDIKKPTMMDKFLGREQKKEEI